MYLDRRRVWQTDLWKQVKKKTRWITNSAAIASSLKRACKQSGPRILSWKRYLSFEEGKVKANLRYPPKLAHAIVMGIKAQLIYWMVKCEKLAT
jgi:hypothetical protein